MANIKLSDILDTSVVKASPATVVDGATTLNIKESEYYEITLDSNLAVTLDGFEDGRLKALVLELKFGGAFAITWNNPINWIGRDGVFFSTLSETNVFLKDDGTSDFIFFYSTDGGATIYGKVVR